MGIKSKPKTRIYRLQKEITGIVYHNQLVDETKFAILLGFRYGPVNMKLINYIFLNVPNSNLKSVFRKNDH